MTRYNGKAPTWFDLNNYNDYKQLNSKQLCKELHARHAQKLVSRLTKNTADLTNLELFTCSQKQISNRNDGEQYIIDKQLYDLNHETGICSVLNPKPVTSLTYKDIERFFLFSRKVLWHYENEIDTINEKFYKSLDDSDIDEGFFQDMKIKHVRKHIGILKEKANNINNDYFENIGVKEELLNGIEIPFRPTFENSAEDEAMLIYSIYGDTNLRGGWGFPLDNNLSFFKIDLSISNEIIIDELKKHLTSLRKNRNITTNNSTHELVTCDKKSGAERVVKSIIENRIIPYLDLSLWADINGLKPTHAWYKKLLFKDLLDNKIDVSATKINDTVKKQADKYINPNWIRSFYYFDLPSYNNLFLTKVNTS